MASLEFTEWHLCPQGWVRGTTMRDGGQFGRSERPVGTVMSITWKETASAPGPVFEAHTDPWIPDEQSAAALLAEFGSAPRSL